MLPYKNPTPECFKPKLILEEARIDDFGEIGGIVISNNTPCDSVSTFTGPADMEFTVVGDHICFDYKAESETQCGPPTRIRAKIKLSWDDVE